MAPLPNADNAFVEPGKMANYLLSDTHAIGAPKARFFKRFGFTASHPDELTAALLLHAKSHDAVAQPPTIHGTKYVVTGPLPCPDGRLPLIKAVWVVDAGQTAPRFVTAVPA